MRLRPSLQGLPRARRPHRRSRCSPAVRGPGRRVRLGRAARDRPGGHRARSRVRGRARSHPLHGAADGLPGAGPARRPGVRRPADDDHAPATSAATSATALASGAGRRPGHPGAARRPEAAAAAGPPAAGPARPRRPARGDGPRGLRLLAGGVRRAPSRARRGAGLDGARQAARRPHDAAGLGARGLLGVRCRARETCAGCCRRTRSRCSTRWRACTVRARSAGSARAARFVGTFRAHGLLVPVWDLPAESRPTTPRSRRPRFRSRLDDALGERAPLTGAERHARSGLQTRQMTLR